MENSCIFFFFKVCVKPVDSLSVCLRCVLLLHCLYIFQGQLCDRCDVRLHANCAARFFSNTEPKCPNPACKAAWPHEVPEGARTNRGTEGLSLIELSNLGWLYFSVKLLFSLVTYKLA